MRLREAVNTRFDERDDEWKRDVTWSEEHIGRRLNRLAQVPLQAMAQVGDLVVGGGRILVSRDRSQLDDGGDLAADLFFNTLQVINPHAVRKGDVDNGERVRLLSERVREVDFAPLGFGPVGNRLAYLARGLLLVVTRIIDLAIGIFATACALISFGQEKEINGAAYEGLRVGRLLGDLIETLQLMIDPYPSSAVGLTEI